MLRFDGSDGHNERTYPDEWKAARRAAQGVIHAAERVTLRPGSETVVNAQALIDALDLYWQARFGGRVIIVSRPDPDMERDR